jgi:outer membrane protein W
MSAKQHFFLYFFLLIAVPTFTQITKGSKTIGYAYLGFQINSQSNKNGNNEVLKYNHFQTDLYFNTPSYMVTNRLQLGLGIGHTFSKSSSSVSTSVIYSFSFLPEINYYFTQSNGGFYVNAGGNLNLFINTVTNDTNPTFNLKETNSKNNSWHVGLGYILPVNDNVFLKAQLNYNNYNLTNAVNLNIGLTNFLTRLKSDDNGDTPQYIRVGRSIVDGYYAMNYNRTENISNFSFGTSCSRLKFLNEHLAFGGYVGADAYFDKLNGNRFSFRAGTKARYYIPMSKKWFIYPELGLGFGLFNENRNKSQNINLIFSKSVGINYFITPSIALDVNVDLGFYSSENNNVNITQTSDSNFNTNLRFGVTYLIDKLF